MIGAMTLSKAMLLLLISAAVSAAYPVLYPDNGQWVTDYRGGFLAPSPRANYEFFGYYDVRCYTDDEHKNSILFDVDEAQQKFMHGKGYIFAGQTHTAVGVLDMGLKNNPNIYANFKVYYLDGVQIISVTSATAGHV